MKGRRLLLPALLFSAALLLRLRGLDRPLDFDEGLHAYYSYFLYSNHWYEYLPDLHGPLLYYLTAGVFGLAGPSVAAARAAVALAGASMVLLPWLLRRRIGEGGAFAAAVFIAFSPLFVSQSSQLRNDVLVALFLLGTLVAAEGAERRRGWPFLWAAPVLLALALATKETALVSAGLALVALPLSFAPRFREFGKWASGLLRERKVEVAGAGTVLVLVATLLFSFFFQQPAAALEGWLDSPRFWFGAALGGFRNPALYGGPDAYFRMLAPADLLLTVLGLVGGVLLWRTGDRFLRFLAAWALLSVALFVAIPYKADRLALNFLLPAALVAGAAVGRWKPARLRALLVAAFIGLSLLSLPAAGGGPGDYGRLEAAVHSLHPGGGNATLVIPATADPKYGIGWPLPWYIRDENFSIVRVQAGVPGESVGRVLDQIEAQRPGSLVLYNPAQVFLPESIFASRNYTRTEFPGIPLRLYVPAT